MSQKGLATILCVLLMVTGPAIVPALTPEDDRGQAASTFGQTSRSLVHDEGDEVVLENGVITLRFNKTAGALLSVLDPVTGIEFRADKDMSPMLFQVIIMELVGGTKTTLSDASSSNITFVGSQTQGLAGISFTFKEIGSTGIEVVARIEVRDQDPRSYWDIEVINTNLSIAVNEVRYPIVCGVPSDIGSNGMPDVLSMPRFDGIIYNDPYPKTQPPFTGDFRFQYPRELSMQFMAFYDPSAAGLYLDAQDPDGNIKEFFMEDQGPDNNVMVGISHLRPDTGAAGTGKMYRSSMSIFHGGWDKAADLYKGWAINQTWTSKGLLLERSDIPSWWLDPAFMAIIERTDLAGNDKVSLEQWSDIVSAYKAITGTNITLKVLGWEHNGSLTGPYYLPPKDGDAELSTEIKEVIVAGGHVMLSTSEPLWRTKVMESGFDGTAQFLSGGQPWAVITTGGAPAMDQASQELGHDAAVMDTTTVFWQDLQASTSAGIAGDAVDIQELTDLPSSGYVPCYNISHGHPAGFGKHMTNGHLSLLYKTRKAGTDVNPDFMITIDGPSELLLSSAQSQMSPSNAPERGPYLDDLNKFGNAARPQPMFAYVFHEYSTAYGAAVPLGGLEMPAYFNASSYSLAKAYVDGSLQSGIVPGMTTGNQKLSILYGRTSNAMATYARNYNLLGQMLPPPTLSSPMAQVPFRVDPRPGQEAAGWSSIDVPQVLSSGWKDIVTTKTPTSSYGAISLVNWGNSSADVSLTIPTYGLPDINYSIMMVRNGERSMLKPSTKLPVSMGLTLGARDVVQLELFSGPDISLEGLAADNTDPITGDLVNLTVDLANIGSAVAQNLVVTVFENGTFFDQVTIGQLGPDTNATLPFTWSSQDRPLGTYNLTAKIWPVPGELMTDNNEMSLMVTVHPIPKGAVQCIVLHNSTKAQLTNVLVSLLEPGSGNVLSQDTATLTHDATFTDLLPGTYGLNATRQGYFPTQDDTVLVEPLKTTYVTLLLIPLPPVITEGDITGVIRDNASKAPLSNAQVLLVQYNTSYYTGADGVYLFTGVTAGIYDVIVTRPGYHGLSIRVTIVAGEMTYANVSLSAIPIPPKAGDLVGYVTDKSTNRPISSAIVRLFGGDLEPMEMTTDPAGGFAFSQIIFGSYYLNVSASGYLPEEVPAVVDSEGANEMDVALVPIPVPPAPKVTLTGFVLDKSGKPLGAAKIQLLGSSPAVTVYSDSSGLYQFEGLSLGQISLLITREGYRDTERSINATSSGTIWLNITMVRKASASSSTGTMGTYVLVTLIVLMLVGIILMVVTGRRETERGRRPKAERAIKGRGPSGKIPVVAVRKVTTRRHQRQEEE